MAEQSAQASGTRIDGAIEGVTPAVETIQAFAREIAQMSRQALVRTNQHIERLRKAHRIEEAAAIQADFLKESMEHAVQHTRKYIEMLTTFPHDLVKPAKRR
jgi:phasin family protein